MSERDIDGKQENDLSREKINEEAQSLFKSTLVKLSTIDEFKDVLVNRYLKAGEVVNDPAIFFDRNGYKYHVLVDRDVRSDQLEIGKMRDGIEERIYLWLTYDEFYEGSCRLFGGTRGNIDHTTISYLTFNWSDTSKENEHNLNTQESIDKTIEFINSI